MFQKISMPEMDLTSLSLIVYFSVAIHSVTNVFNRIYLNSFFILSLDFTRF